MASGCDIQFQRRLDMVLALGRGGGGFGVVGAALCQCHAVAVKRNHFPLLNSRTRHQLNRVYGCTLNDFSGVFTIDAFD